MPRIVFEPNKGEFPIAGWSRDAGYAKCAINTKFWHGLLQPHQCPSCHCKKYFDILTMYPLDECPCLAWDTVVDVADCFCNFIFWTGDGKPQISTHKEICEGIHCNLGIPCPTKPLVVEFDECVDEHTPCIEACDKAYDECIAAAKSGCDDLKKAMEDAKKKYDDCLKSQACWDGTGEKPNCDELYKAYVEALKKYNECLQCIQDEIDKCGEIRDKCKEDCPPEGCCDSQCVYFLYRYVNKYGQVGVPSKPSDMKKIAFNEVESVKVSGIPEPDDGYCISQVEIFMAVAGNKTGLESPVVHNSDFMSLGVFDLADSIDVPLGELGLALDSFDYFPPPENLEGIECTDMGLAGFEGKNIWFTEPNQPHAWSRKKCLDHEVKGIKYWNGILFAATDSWLYRMNLVRTEGDYDFSDPFRYGDRPLPMLSDQRGMSSGQAGVFYPSVMGGVLANDSLARYITSKFGKDDWMSLNPKSMKTAVFDYGVGFFSCNASYVYEWGDGSFGELEGHLYQLPFTPDAVHVDKNGILNYAIGSRWCKWDACYSFKNPCEDCEPIPIECCPYTWEGEPLVFDTQARLTAGFIEFVPSTGDVKIELFKADCLDEPFYVKTFNEGTERCRKNRCFRKYFRLPACNIDDQIYIRLKGCAHVRRVVLATSRRALAGE